jgi:hypothetical protein
MSRRRSRFARRRSSSRTSRRAEYRRLRLTALELYAETARGPESRPRDAVGQPLPPPRTEPARNEATCRGYTQDALFDCRDDEATISRSSLLDDAHVEAANPHTRHHEPDECYGARGAGCGGKCIEVPVACLPTGAGRNGTLCYQPHPEDGHGIGLPTTSTRRSAVPPGTTVQGKAHGLHVGTVLLRARRVQPS